MSSTKQGRGSVVGVLLAAALTTGIFASVGVQGCSSGGSGDCTPDLASIRSTIFVPSCATGTCHSAAEMTSGMDLSAEDVESQLVGVPSISCDPWLRVVPGSPEKSLLYAKLGDAPPCGAKMPLGGSITAAQKACIQGWIASLPPVDGGTCTMCGGPSCIDLQSSAAHCGDCGQACSSGVTCVGGACSCPTGQSDCGAGCVDTTTNPASCGGCGTPCPSASGCAGGQCKCLNGYTPCAGKCTDTLADPANCGGCGKACPGGGTCSGGACACPSGTASACGGCVDVQSDPKNCGACGKTCAATQVCNGGACSSSCTSPLKACGGGCVDTATNAANCGACGNVCPSGASCVNGVCGCPAGTSACNGACVNTTTDPANCGACGKVCPAGASCTSGACACPAGTSLCNGACVNTASDATNCGACGNTCGPGQVCSSGACNCGASVSFAGAVQPIFNASCAKAGCHAGAMPAQGLNLSAGMAYADLVGVAASECSDGRQRVLKGDAVKSYLIQKLTGTNMCSGTPMPKTGSLSGSQVALIGSWICAGAPNN